VIGADPKLLGELALGELAVRDHAVRGLDDPFLEHGIEGARVEMVVVGHHRHGQAIVAAGPQRGRAHEADGVRAQHVELLGVPHALDVARPHEGRHVPAKPLGRPHGMDGQPRHPLVALASSEENMTLLAERGEILQELPLVHFAARARLGRDAAMRREDAH
jgi:hypothetical protein